MKFMRIIQEAHRTCTVTVAATPANSRSFPPDAERSIITDPPPGQLNCFFVNSVNTLSAAAFPMMRFMV